MTHLEHQTTKSSLTTFDFENINCIDVQNWIKRECNFDKEAFILIFQDNGVIWGKFTPNNKSISLSCGMAAPESVENELFQQLYVFNQSGQIHVWKDSLGFHGTKIVDDIMEGIEEATFDQSLYLWGTGVIEKKNGFSLLADGKQGMNHAVPIEDLTDDQFIDPKENDGTDEERSRKILLNIRNYIGYVKDNGAAYVKYHRLLDQSVKGEEK